MLKPAALAVALLWKFLFGGPCPRCVAGELVKRWYPYDGTGSWRVHRSTFQEEDDDFCKRNGWFSRHWFATAMVVFAIGFFVIAGVNAARAADRPEKPSPWFCMQARMHRAQFATDKAAEDSALVQGASRADIAKAHRCKR